jgi:radical SAM-linked protein
LGVGICGHNEVLDFELSEWVRPEEVRQRLAGQLPEGIRIESLEVPPSKPDRRPRQLSYRIPLLEGHPVTQATVQELVAAGELKVRRAREERVKTVDIRPFIAQVRLRDGGLLLLLNVSEAGTARPEEVLQALGCVAGVHYLQSAIERTHVNLSSSL